MFYKSCRALYSIDNSWDGFTWLNPNDADNNIITFKRIGDDGSEVIAIISFNGSNVNNYKINVEKGKYKVVLSSDDKKYGGTNTLTKKTYNSRFCKKDKTVGFRINIPKLSAIYLKKIID